MTWQPELDEVRRRRELAERMGGPAKVGRQHEAGGNLADFTAANFVVGTGRVDGRKVVVGGDDFTIRGGAADAAIAGKQVYAEQLAHELRLPLVRLVEGTGGGGSVKMLEQLGHTYVPAHTRWGY